MELTSLLQIDQLTNAQAPSVPLQTKDAAKARAAAEDFEAFFVSMFLDSMFSGIKTDSLFGGGHAEGVYRSLLNQEYGKTIVKSGGIGLADNVQREILMLQEAINE